MSAHTQPTTAAQIMELARKHHVAYAETQRDTLAGHITRLAGDEVQLDDVERLLIALQRGGHLTRAEMVKLQASYLHEVRP